MLNFFLKLQTIYQSIYFVPFLLFFLGSVSFGDKQPGYESPAPSVSVEPKAKDRCYKRISENGAEVLVDGSLRVLEPVMGKVFDLVEVSSPPVTPIANHVRLYVVGIGTYTVIRALFDDGTNKVLLNN